MNICDRCFNRDGIAVKSTEKVEFENSGERFDLCSSCIDKMWEYVDRKPEPPTAKKKIGRKRTRKTAEKTQG